MISYHDFAIRMARGGSNPGKLNETKAERARRYLTGGGVVREDSDDELGLDDHPWEWIHSTEPQDNGEDFEEETNTTKITGARMGAFECRIGDCVLLKAEGANEAWIGIICDFQEEDDREKAANFMWFSTQKEIRNKQKKRTDFTQVCSSPTPNTPFV